MENGDDVGSGTRPATVVGWGLLVLLLGVFTVVGLTSTAADDDVDLDDARVSVGGPTSTSAVGATSTTAPGTTSTTGATTTTVTTSTTAGPTTTAPATTAPVGTTSPSAPSTTVTTSSDTTDPPVSTTTGPSPTSVPTTTTPTSAPPTTEDPDPDPDPDGEVAWAVDRGVVTMTGAAEADQRRVLETAAGAAFGAGNVVDELDGGEEAATLAVTGSVTPEAAAAVEALAPELDEVGITLDLDGMDVVPLSPEGSALQDEIDDAAADADLRFPPGDDTLTAEQVDSLGPLADVLAGLDDVLIEVAAHTAADDAATLALSQRQADAVADALVAGGVERSILRPVGQGGSQPVDPPDRSDEDRRVELVVVE